MLCNSDIHSHVRYTWVWELVWTGEELVISVSGKRGKGRKMGRRRRRRRRRGRRNCKDVA